MRVVLVLLVLVFFFLLPGASAYVVYNSTASTGSTTIGGSQDHAFNFNVSESVTVDKMHIELDTVAAGGVWRFLIYTDNSGSPGSLTDQSYNISMAKADLNESALNVISWPSGTTLTSGTYWIMLTADPFDQAQVMRYFRSNADPLSYSGLQYSLAKPYSWTVWAAGANDATASIEVSAAGSSYSLPDAVSEADWVYPATDPDTDNQGVVWLNWSNSTSSISATLNYTLYINGSWEWSGLNISQYEWTIPSEAHYLLRVDVQDNGTWVTGDNRKYIYDATSPAIVWGGDVASDNSTVTAVGSVWVNNSLSDDNAVWGYNVSLSYGANGTIISYFNLTGISEASTSFNRSFSLYGLPSGSYLLTTLVSDSHTRRAIKDFRPVQRGLRLEYEAYGGLISVEVEDVMSWDYRRSYSMRRSDKQAIRSFTTWKEQDRYVFNIDTALPNNPFRTYEYSFLVSAEERIEVVEGSDYFAHLIVGRNWVDFEHSGAESFWVERINDNVVRVRVYSSAEKAAFRSIGGLNSLTESLEFEIDVTAPAIGSEADENGSAYVYSQAWEFNATITDANGVSSVWLEFNGTNYTATNVAGNIYQDVSPINVEVGKVYSYKFHANDTLNNWRAGTAQTFEVVQGSYSLSFTNNHTPVVWVVSGGVAVSVNVSEPLGVNVLLYRNGTAVSIPDDIDNALVGIYNYTAYGGSVNWSNVTFSQVLNVTNSTITQQIPVMSSVRLWSLTNTTLNDFLGYATATDANADTVSYEWKWYRDSVLYSEYVVNDTGKAAYDFRENATACVGSFTYANACDDDPATYYTCGSVCTLLYSWNLNDSFFYDSKMIIKELTGAGGQTNTYTLPDECTPESTGLDAVQVKLILYASSNNMHYSCWNGSVSNEWQVVTHIANPTVYDVSMNFTRDSWASGVEVNRDNVSSSVLSLGDSWVLSGRAFDGLNYSSWLNSSALSVTLPSLNNCSSGSVVVVLKYFDEDNPTVIMNNSAEVEGVLWADRRDEYVNFSFVFGSNATHPICLSLENGSYFADAYVKYDAAFTHRFYWVNESLVPGSAEAFLLYNFPSVGNQSVLEITARVKSSYEYYPGVYARLQRLYVGEGLWRTVQMARSGAFGLMTFDIFERDTDYKLIFLDSASNVLETSDELSLACVSSTCELTYLLTPYAGVSSSAALGYSWSYDNSTGNITVSFSDPAGLTSTVRVVVTKERGDGTLVICNSTVSASAGSVVCDVSGYEGQVLLTVHGAASPESRQYSVWINLANQVLSGLVGNYEAAMWSFGILLVVVGASVASPIAGIIGMILGLIAILYLGLFSALTMTFVIVATIMGIAIGIKVKD